MRMNITVHGINRQQQLNAQMSHLFLGTAIVRALFVGEKD